MGGEVIRQKVADAREKRYEDTGIGSCYLFRLSDDAIVDATRTGTLSRFINHCCEPNAHAKVVPVESGNPKIMFFAKRTIEVGEEITYDYKFAPDSGASANCRCSAKNCTGFL